MKWIKDNWFMLALIVSVIFMFWEWQCNAPKPPDNGKKQNDSLTTVINKVEMASINKTDSLARGNDSLINWIGYIESRNEILSDSLSATKKNIRLLQAEIKTPDTIGLMDPACLSLSDDFDKYILMSEEKEKGQDSINKTQMAIIDNLDTVIAENAQFTTLLHQSFTTCTANYDALYKNFNYSAKKIQWFKIKEKGLLAIVLAETGKIILSSLKK